MTEQQTQTSRHFALVTGASSGIGLALARQFAENGFDLVIAAEDPGIHRVSEELAALGADVFAEEVDLATPLGVEALHRAATAGGRTLDAVALNAGVGVGGPFAQTDLEADLRLVDLNVRSTVHLAKLLVPAMVARGEGRLLFTASIAATAPGPYYATYAASKAFVHSFAQALRTELKDTGVSVTSLMPGPTDTEFFVRADMEDTAVGTGPKDDPDDVARDGFEALMAGKDHVVAGSRRNSLQAGAASLLPDAVGARAQAAQAAPGSGN
jgi:uncharacterized protein